MEIGQVAEDMTNLHAVDKKPTSDIIVQVEMKKMGKHIMQMKAKASRRDCVAVR